MAKKETLLGGAIWALGWLLILLPVALAFLFVYLYGVTVVHVDQWEIIPRFEKLSLGTLGVSDLFAPHNQHRMLFPWIAMLGLGTFTKYNNVAEMYFTLACFLGMLTALILVFRGSIKPRLPFLLPVFFVPIAFLVLVSASMRTCCGASSYSLVWYKCPACLRSACFIFLGTRGSGSSSSQRP